jgi:hypothetical protein
MKNSFAVTGLPMEGTPRQSAKTIVAMFAGLFLLSTGISGCFGMISGCVSSMANGEQQAQSLAATMHQKMASNDLAGIYDGASQRYKDAVTREKSDDLFSAIARKLGAPGECKQQGFNMNSTTSGTILKLTCETKFSKDATGTETFAWIKSEDQYQLLGYHIESEELIER